MKVVLIFDRGSGWVTLVACLIKKNCYCNGCPPGTGSCSLRHRFQTGSRAHPQWVLGTLSLGVRQPEREGYHSPPSSAEVENA